VLIYGNVAKSGMEEMPEKREIFYEINNISFYG